MSDVKFCEKVARKRIIVALDVDSVEKATNLVRLLASHVGAFKIGLEFINSMLASIILASNKEAAEESAQGIRELFQLLSGKIFWDGKFNDIPNTVAGASMPLAKMGVSMFNVHASAGRESIAQAVAQKGISRVLGVSVLTSINEEECVSIFGEMPGIKVLRFAEMLVDVGADGIICSPKELDLLKRESSGRLLKVVPGIRPIWAAAQDQKRIMTPGEAVKAGANYLVIGRPITRPPVEVGGPVEAAKLVVAEIAAAEAGL